MHPLVKGFMLIWFGGVILIGGTVFWTTVWRVLSGNSRGTQDAVVGSAVPVGMFVFGVALVSFGRYLSRDDSQTLMSFLAKKLDAVTTTHI